MHLCNKQSGSRPLGGVLIALLLALLAGLSGCGGGGGGSSTGPGGNLTVTGTVIVVETGNPPSPAATVAINGNTTTTATDGTFTLSNVAASATTATVTASGEQTDTLALALTSATNTFNLGNIYISSSAYTASASGTIVTPVKGQYQPVSGADVTLSGSTVLSGTDGSFNITGLAVGLGSDTTTQIGLVQAKGYVTEPITIPLPLITGANILGQIIIQSPVGATPGVPYTISGKVEQGTTPLSGITVTVSTSPVTTTTTDSNGNYYVWVVPGAYSVTALNLSNNQSASVKVTLTSAATPVTAPTINL